MTRRRGMLAGLFTVLLGATACAPSAPPAPPSGMRPHLDADWFTFRGAQLGISPEEARTRDAALSLEEPPESALAPEMRVEAALLWRDACASCHGVRGRLENVPEQDPMPRAWGGMGARMGFTFGGDAMRAGIYRVIAEGGAARPDGSPSIMPGWQGRLSREQIWALVAHIESL